MSLNHRLMTSGADCLHIGSMMDTAYSVYWVLAKLICASLPILLTATAYRYSTAWNVTFHMHTWNHHIVHLNSIH